LSFQNSGNWLTGHVTAGLSVENLATCSSVISTENFTEGRQVPRNSLYHNIGVTRHAEDISPSQPGISLELDSSSSDFSPTYCNHLTLRSRVSFVVQCCRVASICGTPQAWSSSTLSSASLGQPAQANLSSEMVCSPSTGSWRFKGLEKNLPGSTDGVESNC